MKFIIKNPAPHGPRGPLWGDYHFGLCLAKYLRRLGVDAVNHFHGRWDQEEAADIVLVLRGKYRYHPRADAFHVLWCMSNPSTVTARECEEYDAVCVASVTHAQRLREQVGVPVHALLQCTDPELFQVPTGAAPRRGVIFVGNSRGVHRPCVDWAVQFGLDLNIHGQAWQTWGHGSRVVSEHVPNEHLPRLYASSRLSLNDHYQDMKALGYINNRVFDCLAAGLPLISDDFPELREACGDALLYYHDQDSFSAAATQALLAYPSVSRRQRDLWQAIGHGFTFASRAEFLFDLACLLLERPSWVAALDPAPVHHAPGATAKLDRLKELAARHPQARYCPVCGTTSPAFVAPPDDGTTADSACPNCTALRRHRALWVVYVNRLQPRIGPKTKRVLHIGPEEQVVHLMQELPDITYRTGDPVLPNVHVRLDLQRIDFADDHFHVVLCTSLRTQLLSGGRPLPSVFSELRRITTHKGFVVIQYRDQPLPGSGEATSVRSTETPETAPRPEQIDPTAQGLTEAGFQVDIWNPKDSLAPDIIRLLDLDDQRIYTASKR